MSSIHSHHVGAQCAFEAFSALCGWFPILPLYTSQDVTSLSCYLERLPQNFQPSEPKHNTTEHKDRVIC